jgi:hypothetical protein
MDTERMIKAARATRTTGSRETNPLRNLLPFLLFGILSLMVTVNWRSRPVSRTGRLTQSDDGVRECVIPRPSRTTDSIGSPQFGAARTAGSTPLAILNHTESTTVYQKGLLFSVEASKCRSTG